MLRIRSYRDPTDEEVIEQIRSVPTHHSGFSVVGSTSAGSADTTSVTTTGFDTSTSKVLAFWMYWATATVPTISDTFTNTWVKKTTYNTAFLRGAWFYTVNPIVGASHTVTATFTSSFPAIYFAAFTNSGACTFDKETGNALASASAPPIPTNSITPTNANSLVLAGLGTDTGSAFTISGSSFTTIDHSSGFADGTVAGSYVIQTTASAANPSFSWTTAADAVAGIIAFAGPTGKIFRPANLEGIGAGGPFFANPLT